MKINKSHWVVVFGQPAPNHPAPHHYEKFIGTYVLQGKSSLDSNKPKLFSLRSEAEQFAKEFAAKYSNRWSLSVVKFNVRLPPNPYERQHERPQP